MNESCRGEGRADLHLIGADLREVAYLVDGIHDRTMSGSRMLSKLAYD